MNNLEVEEVILSAMAMVDEICVVDEGEQPEFTKEESENMIRLFLHSLMMAVTTQLTKQDYDLETLISHLRTMNTDVDRPLAVINNGMVILDPGFPFEEELEPPVTLISKHTH